VSRIAHLLGGGHTAVSGRAQRKGGGTLLHAEIARLGATRGEQKEMHLSDKNRKIQLTTSSNFRPNSDFPTA
jgi:hypothetical protein